MKQKLTKIGAVLLACIVGTAPAFACTTTPRHINTSKPARCRVCNVLEAKTASVVNPEETRGEKTTPVKQKEVAPTKEAAPVKIQVAPTKETAPVKIQVAPMKEAEPAKMPVAPTKEAEPVKMQVAPTKEAEPVKMQVAPIKEAEPAKVPVAPTKPAKMQLIPVKIVPTKPVTPAPVPIKPAEPVKIQPAPMKPAEPAKVQPVKIKIIPAKPMQPAEPTKVQKVEGAFAIDNFKVIQCTLQKLGVSPSELESMIKQGKTLSDVLKDKKINVKRFRRVLLKQYYCTIKEALDKGQITKEEAGLLKGAIKQKVMNWQPRR